MMSPRPLAFARLISQVVMVTPREPTDSIVSALTNLHLANHSAFHMARDCACEVDRPDLIKLPDQAATLAGIKRNRIWFGMLHAWVLTHFNSVSLQVGKRTNHHFMGELARIF